MNTITIMSLVEGEPNVIYSEGEVLRYIEKAKEIDKLNDSLAIQYKIIRTIKEEVRDFFSEGEWNDSQFSASKSDINELLESIGANKLTSTYGGAFTITGTFSIEAEDEDEAENIFVEGVDVTFHNGDISIDDTEVTNVSEDY